MSPSKRAATLPKEARATYYQYRILQYKSYSIYCEKQLLFEQGHRPDCPKIARLEEQSRKNYAKLERLVVTGNCSKAGCDAFNALWSDCKEELLGVRPQ